MNVLPDDRRDTYLLQLLRLDVAARKTHPAYEMAEALDHPVGTAAGREILSRVRSLLLKERDHFSTERWRAARERPTASAIFDPDYHDYHLPRFLQALRTILPLDLVDEAAALADLGAPPRPIYAETFSQTIDRLRFRRDMHREFAP
jgi:hypothetical protein